MNFDVKLDWATFTVGAQSCLMIQYDVKTVNELFDLSAFFENNFMVSNK